MTDGASGAAAPVGTTHNAPAAPAGGANNNPAPQGGPDGQNAPAAPVVAQPGSGDQPKAPDGQQPDPAAPKAPDAQNAPAGEFKVPEAYKDKPWAAKVKSMDDVFKQLDNLDALAGKKAIVPDLKTATPEQKEAFYAQLRPKDASAYTMPDDLNGFPIAQAVKDGVGKMFFENGISEVQGNAVIAAYNELGKAQLAEQFSAEGMKAAMKTQFGDNGEVMIRQTRNTIKGMMTPEDAAMLDKLPNNYLGVIYRTLGNTIKHFGVKETDTAHFNAGTGNAGGNTGGNADTARTALRAQLAALQSQPHTVDQANELRNKLADTYKNDPRIQR